MKRNVASRAFAAHPFSVAALADAAHAWRFHGRCIEGVPMLRRAVGLMNLGGDPQLVRPLPDSYRDALQAAAARDPLKGGVRPPAGKLM